MRAELFPIVEDGIAKPVILKNVEELVAAGIKRVIIIVQDNDLAGFTRLFKSPLPQSEFNKLSLANQEYSKRILKIGESVEFLVQETQEGYSAKLSS